MALVNLKTDLRNLKYSEFDSKGPYIVKDVSNQQYGDPFINQVDVRRDDLKRITEVLKDSPNFAINQTGLRFVSNTSKLLSANSNKEKREAIRQVALSPVNAALAIGSLLAQVPVSGTGLHVTYELRERGGNTYLGKLGNLRTLYGKSVDDKSFRESSPLKLDIEDKLNTNSVERPKNYPQGSTETYLGELDTTTKESKEGRSVVPIKEGYINIKAVKSTLETGTRYEPDRINVLDIQTAPLDNQSSDIIPFEIGIVTPEITGEDTSELIPNEYLYFRAYLENLNDDFNGNWSSVEYVGRGEPLYTYTGFSRSIRFRFRIAAESEEELRPLYRKLNKLVGSLSPSYSQSKIFMRGIFTRLTIGDYLYKLPGFFNNISLNWDKSYPWEIGVERITRPVRERPELMKVPHILDVDCAFTPIHSFIPQYGKTYFGNENKLN